MFKYPIRVNKHSDLFCFYLSNFIVTFASLQFASPIVPCALSVSLSLVSLAPCVRKSKTVFDSGLHTLDSEFLVSGTWIPDFNVFSRILESLSKIFPGFCYVGQKRPLWQRDCWKSH